MASDRSSSVRGSAPSRGVVLVGLLACVAALILHGYPVLRPALFDDDFLIVSQSWTWSAAWRNLWLPNNEHAMPLGRLTTAVLVDLGGGRPTAMPGIMAWQGPLAVVFGMVLIGVFVTREMGHAFYGLVVMILFGLTQKYNEAVFWFSASFTLLALDTTLLALLAAQRWRRTQRVRDLGWCVLWCGVAPTWFALGVLAGPLCALYLLPWPKDADSTREPMPSPLRMLVRSAAPLVGTLAFLTLSLTFTADKVVHAEHHAGRSLASVFSPVKGLQLSARMLVDSLIIGVFPATGEVASTGVVAGALILLATVGSLWWRVAPRRRLMLLGLALIFWTYGLIYSFRAEGWSYDQQMVGWTRYNVFPFLGFAFFICGGLPSREGSLFQLDPGRGLTRGQAGALLCLTVLLLAVQLPPAIAGHHAKNPNPTPQWATLEHIEAVDARCREFHIDAATARAALTGPLIVPQSGTPPLIDGWELLRGSANPRSMTVDEARHLLRPE
jgi:hypothetical protein